MSDEQRMVTEFHRAFAIAIGPSPSLPDEATCALRIRLIQQEFDELQEAFAQQDVVAVTKELADLLYVLYGTAVSCGVDMAPVFREVHRSNMSKVGVHQRPDGTWIRPAGYSPPHIQSILAAQGDLEPHDATVHIQQQNGDALLYSATIQYGSPHVVHVKPLPLSEDSWPASRTQKSDRRIRESFAIPCPRCGGSFVRRSHRKGLKERLLRVVHVYCFRCQACAHRFNSFRFRIDDPKHYAKHAVDLSQYVRLPRPIPVTFFDAVKPGEHKAGQGVVTDISLGGCYLQTAIELLEDTLLSLELQTAQDTPAVVVDAAIVRTVRPTGVGVEFSRLREPEQERLSQFIRQLLTEQHAPEDEEESR